MGLVFAVGALLGTALSFAMPAGALLAADRAQAALRADTGSSLEKAAAFGDDGEPEIFPDAALADALLVVDHFGGASERKHADAMMKTTLAFVRIAPESLYARALLKRMGSEDNNIDDDLDKRVEERQKNPWWLLAKSVRLVDQGKLDDARAALQRAALGESAPIRAQLELARLALLRGDAGDARALAERIERAAPNHAQARVVGVLAAVVEDARDDSPEKRAVKLKKVRAAAGPRKEGPPKPGEAHKDDEATLLALWHTAQEDGAVEALDHVDDKDAPALAFVLEALASGRGDEDLAAQMKKRVLTATSSSPLLAARQAELTLLEGDPAGADELINGVLEKQPGDEALLLDQARVHALAAWSEDEVHKRASNGTRAVVADGIVLPFGRLIFDVTAPTIPLRAMPDPVVFPEAAFAAALRGSTDKLAKRLDVVVTLQKAEALLAKGDVAGASAAATTARERAPGDADVLLLDARIRLRQGDRLAAREAIKAAVDAAPDDPHVLLVAARLDYDNEDFIPARTPLAKLKQLGFKSPSAFALDAMIEARSGGDRAKAAAAALAEAQNIGADDGEILKARVLLLRDGKDLQAVRDAATRLLAVDQLRTSDPILRAWEADAAARAGETLKAEATLKDVIAARPNLADAYLLLGSIQAGHDKDAAIANLAKATQLAPGSAVAAEAARRRAAIPGAGPPPKLPRKKPR